jgi:CRP-like cAMP-binding protein
MELDLNKFRTLIPINALYEDNLLRLAEQTKVERLSKGDKVFSVGDLDPDSLFLMAGTVAIDLDENNVHLVTAGNDAALYALTTVNPRQFDAFVVSKNATIARVDAVLLEKLLTWGQAAPLASWSTRTEENRSASKEDSEWMMAMLRTGIFLQLPASNIHELFSRMEQQDVTAGTEVVRHGEEGDYYYMIKKGRCQVSRPKNGDQEVLAELGRNDCFGEEALLSDEPRNATVTMLSDGQLMRLAKQDFIELLNEPTLKWVNNREMKELVINGAKQVDVRLESEYENSGLKNALNIPLHELRKKSSYLEPSKKYVLYCDTGQRSASAAFLLGQRGFDVYVLEGGLSGSSSGG